MRSQSLLNKSVCVAILSIVFISCGARPIQFNRSSADDFGFEYHFGSDPSHVFDVSGRNEVNTFEECMVKDLDFGGIARADYQLTTDDAATIKKKLEEMHFFDLPGPNPQLLYYPGIYDMGHPNKLRVVWGHREKYLEWDTIHGGSRLDKALMELRTTILKIVTGSSAWKSLPPAEGGRL